MKLDVKPSWITRARDAVTGRFVSLAYAALNATTTVVSRIRRKPRDPQ